MYARVTHIQSTPDRLEAGIDSFSSNVVPAAKGLDGFKGALLLADRTSSRGIVVTLWDTEDTRAKGAEALAQARSATLQAMGAGTPPVDEYEVVVSEL